MVVSCLYMDPAGGDYGEFVGRFVEMGILEAAVYRANCIWTAVSVPTTVGLPILVTAVWGCVEDYEKWLRDPWRAKAVEELAAVGSECVSMGGVYTIVHLACQGMGRAE